MGPKPVRRPARISGFAAGALSGLARHRVLRQHAAQPDKVAGPWPYAFQVIP